MKGSSVVYLAIANDDVRYLVVSLSTRPSSIVIRIDQHYGAFSFQGLRGYDVFDTEEKAVAAIAHSRNIDIQKRAIGIIGHVFVKMGTLLFLVEEVEECCVLFGEHPIYTVSRVNVIETKTSLTHSHAVDGRFIRQFPFHVDHFFCPTFNLNSLVDRDPSDTSYVWNRALTDQFDAIQPGLCLRLFQGFFVFRYFVTHEFTGMLMCSRRVPSRQAFTVNGIVNGATGLHNYDINVMMAQTIGGRHVVLRHRVNVCDLPFKWKAAGENIEICQDGDQETEVFLEEQKKDVDVQKLVMISLMNDESKECVLIKELERVEKMKGSEMVVVHLDSQKFEAFADETVQEFWTSHVPALVSNDLCYTKSYVHENGNPLVDIKQDVACQFIVGVNFEGGILGLFLYLVKVLEDMGNRIYSGERINITDTNVLERKYGYFAEFISSAILRLGESMNLLGFLEKKLKAFTRKIMHVGAIERDTQCSPHDLQSTFGQLLALTHTSSLCFTLSPLSFVVFGEVCDDLLRGNLAFQPLPLDIPIFVFLSEPCRLTSIVFNRVSVSHVSIYGGMWLNRMFPIAENVALMTDVLDVYSVTQRKIYDSELDCTEHSGVRFISFVFSYIHGESVAGGISIYGTRHKMNYQSPSLPLPCPMRDTGRSQTTYFGAVTTENVFSWERERLMNQGSMCNLYRVAISQGVRPDEMEIDSRLRRHPPDVSPTRMVCEMPDCQKKSICQPCWVCGRMVCPDCSKMKGRECQCEQCCQVTKVLPDLVKELKELHAQTTSSMYPFLRRHQRLQMSSGEFCDSGRIDLTPTAWSLFEIPNGQNGVSILSLFSDDHNHDDCWNPRTNTVLLHFVLCGMCEIERIVMDCDYPTEISIMSENMEVLRFEPPGSERVCAICKRVIVMKISSEQLVIRRIRFIGRQIAETTYTIRHELRAPRRRPMQRVNVKQSKFDASIMAHVLDFSAPMNVVALRFPDMNVVGCGVVVALYNGNDLTVEHYKTARSLASLKGILYLRTSVPARRAMIWYMRHPHRDLHVLASDGKSMAPSAYTWG